MLSPLIVIPIWICIIITLSIPNRTYSIQMCTYGERGSLTVHCFNATSTFFKRTPYRFDHLDETLKCINCSLTSLDPGTFDINGNQIKTLDIRNSSITEINAKAFIGLIFMEKLLLSNNPIKIIRPGAFVGVRKVKYIEIENSISTLDPLVLVDLRQLEVLNLRRNKLFVFANNTFDGLVSLKRLDLSFNELRTLNECLAPLTSLKILNLQYNKISEIRGNEFSSLVELLELNLEGNVIRNFSINMDANNKLRVLNLSKNQLSRKGINIRPFTNLHNLEDLDLSKNVFDSLPPKLFEGLFRLRNLNLYSNQIKEFSTGTFSGLPHLIRLNLSSNYLETATVTGRLPLTGLHTLDLSNNKIKEFDYILFIGSMPRITHINLLNNYLPCEIVIEIKTLFVEDNIRFLMDNNETANCKNTTKTPNEIIMKLLGEENQNSNSQPYQIVSILLISLVILLLAVLFYIQFFVLNRIPNTTFNIRILRRPGASFS